MLFKPEIVDATTQNMKKSQDMVFVTLMISMLGHT
jgi:hypothetical protein